MKQSKRVLSALVSAAMLLSLLLTACGPAAETPGTASPVPEASQAPAESVPPSQPAPTEEPPAEEYFEPLQDGYNQITFYWSYPGTYEKCDMWIWWENKDGKGYPFHECAYGGKVIVNVPEEVTEIGFIVRRDCSDPGGSSWGSATKDFEQDRFASVSGRETVIYLKTGDAGLYSSNDGGKTLIMDKEISLAGMADGHRIRYRVSPALTLSSAEQVKVYRGDEALTVTGVSTLGTEAVTGYIEVAEELELSGSYRVEIEGYGEQTVIPTEIFDSEYFAANYHYDGGDLGAVIHGDATTFKVWAPTASAVVLNLFEAGDGGQAYRTVEMIRGEKGVWEHTEPCGHGTYYTYTVTTAVGTQEAVDPYARAGGVNGDRGMVVELDRTDPEGWAAAALADPISAYSEAVIWEVHVRDFSNRITSSRYPGKYLAFTETGLVNEHGQSVGVDYLKELGITHVHLLPVYDFATVDETGAGDPFNWGYDPKNYNFPEGSYSTDPCHGEVRIREFKEMVKALHEAGIGVVMDVVYNHTYDANSSLNRIVPYYYYRYTSTGANTSASGCGNDTASERYMYRRFMVDSASYWVEEYRLDGLRFDLMGLHDLETMQQVERAVHSVNPAALLYGEGWTMGATLDGSPQANQTNIGRITPSGDAVGGIAVFNDVIRDGLKGSVFDAASRGYISGAVNAATLADVVFSIRGGQGVGQGWTVNDAMVINYMSAHDNNTLWDKLLLSNGEATDAQRMRMNRLGAAIVMIAKGTPFWQAGEEFLRTKGGDENSYKSGDAVNNLDWSVLRPGTAEHDTMCYYRGLIEMRAAFDLFTDPAAEIAQVEELGSGILAVVFDNGRGGQALAVINPHNTALPYSLDGEWSLVADGERAGAAVLAVESGTVTVDGVSVRIYVNGAAAAG